MTLELQTEAEIESLGIIKYVDAPFDEGLRLITSKGLPQNKIVKFK